MSPTSAPDSTTGDISEAILQCRNARGELRPVEYRSVESFCLILHCLYGVSQYVGVGIDLLEGSGIVNFNEKSDRISHSVCFFFVLLQAATSSESKDMSQLLEFIEVLFRFALRYPLMSLWMLCVAVFCVWLVWSILRVRL